MRHRHSFHSFTFCALTVIALCAAQTVLAQTTVFAYQGKLDFDGVPANGQFDFQFKLFDSLSAGAQQGATAEQLSVEVSNGDYKVNLDFGAAVFNGADRFIEVSFRPTGSSAYATLTPRQQITSSPYAIRSLVATTADGLSITCASCVTSSQIQNVQGSQVTGNLAGSQINGAIPVASVPAGSPNYIQNTTSQQPASNFNISGNGAAAGTLSANVVNATTQYNLGGLRVLSNAGLNNLFAGINAGNANTSGIHNSLFGAGAGQSNTAGQFNSFFGSNAGFSNTTGQGNSFFGVAAGRSNTTGQDNSFFGINAGYGNTTGLENSFFGSDSGSQNTTGQDNSFFGSRAGHFNTSGHHNSFFGVFAGYNNTTGNANSFFGEDAGGANTTGGNNAFFGGGAGASNQAGMLNTFIGGIAGRFSTGSNNTFIGYGADFSTVNPTGDSNTLLGYTASVRGGVSSSTAIGAGAQITASHTVVLGTDQEIVIVPGKLEVDTLAVAGNQQLCLNNNKRLAPCSSSLRYKTDLRPFAAGMSIINWLRPVSFTWKDGGLRDVGFVAEDVGKIEPLLVSYNTQGLVEGVKYDRITVALVNAIKEQQTQITDLKAVKAENAELRAQLADVLVRLQHLEETRDARK